MTDQITDQTSQTTGQEQDAAAPEQPKPAPAPALEPNPAPAPAASAAPATPTPAKADAREPLFSVEYDTDIALLTKYVDVLVGARQKKFALVMAVIDIALAIACAVLASSMWPLALVLGAMGVGMLWYRSKACELTAKKMIRQLDPSEMHRRVDIFDDHVELTRGDDSVTEFALTDLSSVAHNDQIAVLAFDRSGVTVPAVPFAKGSFEEVIAWVERRRADEAESSGDEPSNTPDDGAEANDQQAEVNADGGNKDGKGGEDKA